MCWFHFVFSSTFLSFSLSLSVFLRFFAKFIADVLLFVVAVVLQKNSVHPILFSSCQFRERVSCFYCNFLLIPTCRPFTFLRRCCFFSLFSFLPRRLFFRVRNRLSYSYRTHQMPAVYVRYMIVNDDYITHGFFD